MRGLLSECLALTARCLRPERTFRVVFVRRSQESRAATLVWFEHPRTGRPPLLTPWRYPAFAYGGFGAPSPRPLSFARLRLRGEDSEAFPRSGLAQLGEGLRHSERLVRFRDPSPTSASSLRSQACVSSPLKGRGKPAVPTPERTTPRRSGQVPSGLREPALFGGLGSGGLGPELVPQQAGLFLGHLPLVRPPPRLRGRRWLCALPLGREPWFPRHGRSPERSVNEAIGRTAWSEVNAASRLDLARCA